MTQILTDGSRLIALAAAAWLVGCAAPPVVAPPAPATIEAPVVAPSTTAPRAGGATPYLWSDKLGSSAQRLRSNLQGNNVAVSQTTDQRLWISVPIDAAFAAGRSAVKAPATGWLDQVAVALRELPRAEVQIVSDADATGSETGARVLALERAASARDWMVGRGVLPQRISVAGRSAKPGTPPDQRRLDIMIGEKAPK